MIGIIVLAILGLWVWLLAKISGWIGRQVPAGRWRMPVTALVFVVLLVLPLADEVVGGFQFRALCKREAVVVIDAERVRGQTLRRTTDSVSIPGTAVRIMRVRESFADPRTGEVLGTETYLLASGGWLKQTIPANERNPILISPSLCREVHNRSIAKAYGFSLFPD